MFGKIIRRKERAAEGRRLGKPYFFGAELFNNEDGMETIEVILMVVVSILVVGVIITLLTKDGFEAGEQKTSLIGYIFYKIKEGIDTLFK